jgi:hypothetical protein
MRPTPAYVDAAQQLNDALEHTITNAAHLSTPEFASHRERALYSLTAACHDLAALNRQISPVPARLIDAGVLFGHARALDATPDRLRARIAGRLVTLDHFDLKDLKQAVTAAETASASVARELSIRVAVLRQPAQKVEPMLGPQL